MVVKIVWSIRTGVLESGWTEDTDHGNRNSTSIDQSVRDRSTMALLRFP